MGDILEILLLVGILIMIALLMTDNILVSKIKKHIYYLEFRNKIFDIKDECLSIVNSIFADEEILCMVNNGDSEIGDISYINIATNTDYYGEERL